MPTIPAKEPDFYWTDENGELRKALGSEVEEIARAHEDAQYSWGDSMKIVFDNKGVQDE